MAGLSLQHPWAFAFGLLGNLISFMTYLAPIHLSRSLVDTVSAFDPYARTDDRCSPTFYRIYKSKSTEGFQSVPYVVALFSAMLWIYYALLKTNAGLLITINAAGCVIETVYIVLFLAYASRKARVSTAMILLLLNVGVFGLILLLTLLLSEGEKRVTSLGWVCVGFSVSVFVAPLSIIRRVIRTRSVEYMPFSLSLALTISAVVWFLYGLLVKDKYVALPNVIGFTFGLVQMGLYVFYMNATPAAGEGKEGKLPAEEHVVVNVAKLVVATAAEKSSEVHPVTEMASTVRKSCAAEAAAAEQAQEVAVVDMPHSGEVL